MPNATASSAHHTTDTANAAPGHEQAERPVRYPYEGSAERLAALMHLSQVPQGCTAVQLLRAIAEATGRTLTDQQLADLLARLRADRRVSSESQPGGAKVWYSPAARQAAQVRQEAAALAANRGGTGATAQAD